MARTTATNFTGVNQFPKADAATDLFKKEDVQTLALAVDAHDHTAGKGLPMAAGSIPNGTITSAMIADATIDTADLKDSSVTSAKILDGTIATGDLANSAVTNAKLGADTARANLLTNGGFEIWQRGSGPFTANGAYLADRWQTSINSGTLSVSRDAVNVDVGSQYSSSFSCTFSGTLNRIQQTLNELAPQIQGKVISVSARTRCGTANALRLNVYADTNAGGGAGSVTATSGFDLGTNAWNTLTTSITVPVGANYLAVRCEMVATCSGNLDNVMLVVGSVAADYAPLHPAEDLARCLRYYELLGDTAGGNIQPAGVATGAGQFAQSNLLLRAIKPVTPTSTIVGTWQVANATGPTIFGDKSSIMVRATSAAAGQFYVVNSTASTNITVEANP